MPEATIYKNTLTLKYQTGIDENENPKYTYQRFSRIKTDASHYDIYVVGSLFNGIIASNNKEVLIEEFYTLQ